MLILFIQPFPLDYHQTLLSLLDVLSEVYNKISKILGPSPFPHSAQHMMGPLGLLSPHPGVSYLFSGSDGPPNNDSEASLWGIANASIGGGNGGPGGNFMYGGALGSPPPSWTPALGEMVLKVDGKFKVRLIISPNDNYRNYSFLSLFRADAFRTICRRKSLQLSSRSLMHSPAMGSRMSWPRLIPC